MPILYDTFKTRNDKYDQKYSSLLLRYFVLDGY